MARLRKNETSINITSAAAAPARRKTVAAPRKRAAAESSSPVTEAATAETTAEPNAEPTVDPISEIVFPYAAVTPTSEQIAALAYSYWVERGYTDGSPQQDWLRAEAELCQRAIATA
jgi:hypothetical protein